MKILIAPDKFKGSMTAREVCIAIGNGLITCFNMAQAKARSKKGSEATKAVLAVLSQK